MNNDLLCPLAPTSVSTRLHMTGCTCVRTHFARTFGMSHGSSVFVTTRTTSRPPATPAPMVRRAKTASLFKSRIAGSQTVQALQNSSSASSPQNRSTSPRRSKALRPLLLASTVMDYNRKQNGGTRNGSISKQTSAAAEATAEQQATAVLQNQQAQLHRCFMSSQAMTPLLGVRFWMNLRPGSPTHTNDPSTSATRTSSSRRSSTWFLGRSHVHRQFGRQQHADCSWTYHIHTEAVHTRTHKARPHSSMKTLTRWRFQSNVLQNPYGLLCSSLAFRRKRTNQRKNNLRQNLMKNHHMHQPQRLPGECRAWTQTSTSMAAHR